MPVTQTREIAPAQRLENLRYAIRDLVSLADEVKRQGHKVLYLNVGDPNIFDFATPPHVVEAAHRAMLNNKNGYAPSAGVPEALEAIRAQAERDGISSIQDVFVSNGAGEAVELALTALLNPGDNMLTPRPDCLAEFVWTVTGAFLLGPKALRLSHARYAGLHHLVGRRVPQWLLRRFGQTLFVYGHRRGIEWS